MLQFYICMLLPILVAGTGVPCLSEGSYFSKLFGTATSYRDLRGDDFRIFSEKHKDCEPQAIWLVARQGSSYPSSDRIERFSKLHEIRDEIIKNFDEHHRGTLCKSDLDLIRSWKLNTTQSMSLSEASKKDFVGLGQRLKENFPTIFDKYSPDEIEVRFSTDKNARQSTQALIEGIWNEPLDIAASWENDSLLKNEENCSTWENYTNNPEGIEQVELFMRGPEMQELLEGVSLRLGFEERLSYDTVRDMYDLCSLENDWFPKTIPAWCTAFSSKDFMVFEYLEDLRTFYSSGYRNPAMPKLGCEFVGDIFTKLKMKKPKATLYLGNSLDNMKLFTALGIGDSGPLDAKGFFIYADRKWRTSFLCPKSANIAAVNYKCKKGSYGIGEESRIVFFINERNTARLYTSQNKAMSGLNEFHDFYQILLNKDYCNRDFCENS